MLQIVSQSFIIVLNMTLIIFFKILKLILRGAGKSDLIIVKDIIIKNCPTYTMTNKNDFQLLYAK